MLLGDRAGLWLGRGGPGIAFTVGVIGPCRLPAMQSDDALARLTEMLNAAGVNMTQPGADDVEKTWAVFRRFAEEQVDDCDPRERDGDGILAQYGAWMGPFDLDMTRQFSFSDADGEYDHMAQLHCTFRFESTEALSAAGMATEWSFGRDLAEFFDMVLELPGFRALRDAAAVPISLDLGYSDV